MFPVKAALFSPANPSPGLKGAAQHLFAAVLGKERLQRLLTKWQAAYPVATKSDLPPNTVLLAPLGYPSTLILADLPPITNGRYRGLGNVMVASEVKEKIEEMQSQPKTLLLLSAGDCPESDASGPPSAAALAAFDRAKRHELFLNLLPFYLPHVQHREDLLAPVCQFITANYREAPFRAPLQGDRILQRVNTP